LLTIYHNGKHLSHSPQPSAKPARALN